MSTFLPYATQLSPVFTQMPSGSSWTQDTASARTQPSYARQDKWGQAEQVANLGGTVT